MSRDESWGGGQHREGQEPRSYSSAHHPSLAESGGFSAEYKRAEVLTHFPSLSGRKKLRGRLPTLASPNSLSELLGHRRLVPGACSGLSW